MLEVECFVCDRRLQVAEGSQSFMAKGDGKEEVCCLSSWVYRVRIDNILVYYSKYYEANIIQKFKSLAHSSTNLCVPKHEKNI